MSAQYMPLHGDPPPYNDIECGESQAEQSNTSDDNKYLKPGELVRVMHSDPIVKVVPMRAGWESSTIEVKRSALPNARYQFAVLESWIVISYVLICSNFRFLSSSSGWVVLLSLAAVCSPLSLFFVLVRSTVMRSLLLPIVCSIHVLFWAIIQLILTVKCYREEREYFGGTLFALIAMVLDGSFTIFVMYSHCYETGEAALAAVAAAKSRFADECSEAHTLPSLPYSQPAGAPAQDHEHSMESSQSCPQSSQVTDLGTVRVVRHDPIIKVVPFHGNWVSSYIIVRRSVLPPKLRIMALLTQIPWIVIPIVIYIAGFITSFSVALSGTTIAFAIPSFHSTVFDSKLSITGSRDLFVFVKCVFSTASLLLAVTVASYYNNRTYFVYNLCAIVLLVLFGMLSIDVVYQYHYKAGQAALNALAAERVRSSQPEDDDSHECGSTSKTTSRQ